MLTRSSESSRHTPASAPGLLGSRRLNSVRIAMAMSLDDRRTAGKAQNDQHTRSPFWVLRSRFSARTENGERRTCSVVSALYVQNQRGKKSPALSSGGSDVSELHPSLASSRSSSSRVSSRSVRRASPL